MVSGHGERGIDAARRRLLQGAAGATLMAGLGRAPPLFAAEGRALAFRHTHTGERLRVVYHAAGRYLPEALARLEYLLRDFRTGERHPMDPRLFDLLHALCTACGGGIFEIISGFRSPRTNAMLRRTGGAGVAMHSLHMEGRAIDVRLARFDTARLCREARALRLGGVGYYPESDFVHVDTGRVRIWGADPV